MASMRPAFVGADWNEVTRGLAFASPPPLGLEQDSNLSHEDEWVRLLCIFQQASRGDFGNVGGLVPLLARAADDKVRRAAVRLLAHAATAKLRPELVIAFRDPDEDVRTDAYNSAGFSGDLRFIEPLLAARRRFAGIEREVIMGSISHLLEPEPAELYDNIEVFSPDEYAQRVLAARDRVWSMVGEAAVLEAQTLSLPYLVDRISQLCASEDAIEMSGAISMYIDIFEAMTGTSTVGFFEEDAAARPLTILASVETFRESGRMDRYEAGVRYFFGHRVPE